MGGAWNLTFAPVASCLDLSSMCIPGKGQVSPNLEAGLHFLEPPSTKRQYPAKPTAAYINV